ncbi:MAG: 3-deoxy-7-phosphoheptulonate synthase [Anaeromyxobacter sp.]
MSARRTDQEVLGTLARARAETATQPTPASAPCPYPLASREARPAGSVVNVGSGPAAVPFGGALVPVIAGPCAVEGWEGLEQAALAARAAGARMLRGGAFKPRTSPYAFQGLGEAALRLLARARERTGLPVVTEVMSPEQVPLVAEFADLLQIGARNMQNYDLLRAVGKVRRPVLLKRGLSATVEELLLAAEYVLASGNDQVILCERGIRTFERATRNTLDLSAVALLRQLTHLPVIVDPSHGTGVRSLVAPMALAAVAAGADGLLLEAHPAPDRALSDGAQSLPLEELPPLLARLRAVALAVGRAV